MRSVFALIMGVFLLGSSLVVLPANAALADTADAPLPASADLRQWAVKPGNQGDLSSCISWAVGHTLLGWYANRAGVPTEFSPMYIYAQTHLDNSASGGGSSVAATYRLVTEQGVSTRAGYNPDASDFRTLPTAAQRANAAAYRTDAPTILFQDINGGGEAGVTAIKRSLVAGNPVGIAIPLSESLDELDNTDYTLTADEGAGDNGYHYVIALAYDNGGLWIENSWGTGWGQRGFAKLTWDYVEQRVIEAEHITGFESTIPTTVAAPDAPAQVSGAAEADRIGLTWAPATTRDGSLVTSYRVEVQGAGETRAYTVAADKTKFTVRKVRPLSRYTVKVAALNTGGVSIPAVVKTRTPAGKPELGTLRTRITSKSTRVGWQPAVARGGKIARYTVLVKAGNHVIAKRTMPANARSVVLPGAQGAKRYSVVFSAKSTAGTVASKTLSLNI